ncbi:alanine racemase [Desulfopila aestuarii]|uniref:Alanine racemase n=1 Tax=Desulfopila aestuarii DSM 18488 TaxID=1121416 RepID=A0A1M7YLQ3_9BACT|nr:alanine racemase [Desulfopila aestuarii]SHO53563.1 alanine racemase [Desulfopila aestuarii DSM 18488]
MRTTDRDFQFPIWVEIDRTALRDNFHQVRSHVNKSTKIMAVVKADAYGHGALSVASLLAQEGVDAFGVARLMEAEQLRNGNISQPILIFGYTHPGNVFSLAAGNFIQTVYSLTYAEELHKTAKAAGVKIRVHIKVDTGMGRLGFLRTSTSGNISICQDIRRLFELDTLHIEGIYTHFAASDSEVLESAWKQLDLFETTLSELRNFISLDNLCIHAANSAATMVIPEAHYNMVRPGIMMYGLRPSSKMDSSSFNLKPVMSIKARIAGVKRVPEGFSVGYGSSYRTERQTVIATIPIGYADGYPRILSSLGTMLVHGLRANVIGRVCMDQLMLDVGHIPNVQESDEVVVIGKQGDDEISADELAQMTGTINYEVVSRILARVPRVFIE